MKRGTMEFKEVVVEGVQILMPYLSETKKNEEKTNTPKASVEVVKTHQKAEKVIQRGTQIITHISEDDLAALFPTKKQEVKPAQPSLVDDKALEHFLEKQQQELRIETDPLLRVAIQSIIDDTIVQIKRKTELYEKISSFLRVTKRAEDQKAIEDFQKQIPSFIKSSEDKIMQERQELLAATRMEFYQQLKAVIVNPLWEMQVKKWGGETILDKDGKEVNVPTGIEKMMGVLANNPLPKKSWHNFMLFCHKTHVSCVEANQEKKLTSDQCVKKIKELKSIADQRFSKNKTKYEESAKQNKPAKKTEIFYGALERMTEADLYDVQALKKYTDTMKEIHPVDSVSRLVSNKI